MHVCSASALNCVHSLRCFNSKAFFLFSRVSTLLRKKSGTYSPTCLSSFDFPKASWKMLMTVSLFLRVSKSSRAFSVYPPTALLTTCSRNIVNIDTCASRKRCSTYAMCRAVLLSKAILLAACIVLALILLR
jgi:hypothetical protein